MNAHDDWLPESDDDPLLDEMLSPFKRLEPPLAARIANRQAVSAALCAFPAANQQRHLPWWRRSISIPVPWAAALAMLLVVASFSSVRNWQARTVPRIAAPPPNTKDAATAAGNDTVAAQRPEVTLPTWKYYETETYLCGVGRVSSESYYIVQE
jgi:hypothetical protein